MESCNCQTTIIHQEIVDDVKNKMLLDDQMIDLADFFKLFGDGTRLKIINALIHSKMCVCDIASVLCMSHSAISHQLQILREAQIVNYTKIGKMVYYELDDDHIKKIFDQGCDHLYE